MFAKLRPNLIIDSGDKEDSASYRHLLAAVRKSGAKYRIAERGQELDLGNGVIMQILDPAATSRDVDPNTHSVVVRVIYGKTAFVFAADADDLTESEILASGHPVRAQVLQVGHHGSRTTSSPEWLAAIHPRIAIISCGRHNLYGHPSPQTLARLASLGARIYRTDTDGAVTVLSDGTTIAVSPMARR